MMLLTSITLNRFTNGLVTHTKEEQNQETPNATDGLVRTDA
jgi:hypothetical protein